MSADASPFGGAEEPGRAPLACGALGRFDRQRVERMATLLGGGLRVVHDDGDSILMLDRDPLTWNGRRERALGWIEGARWSGEGVEKWQAASRRGACGLAISGRRRLVHSAINGLAPVHWTDHGDATYFASRIDPLARSSPAPLSVDWEAWASIVALRYPLGERTPFAEIRRLGPFATLRRRFGRARAQSPSWPWAEIEPHLDLEAGSEATAAALREALSTLEGDVLCPLSGGFDSRLLLSVLAGSERASPTAVTLNDDEGADFEERFAGQVTSALGIDHERLQGAIEDYWADWEERARRVEYQFVDHAWLMPLARRIAGTRMPVPDGYALDTFLQTGSRFHTSDVLDTRDPEASNRALFDGLRRYGLAHEALDERFHAAIVERARTQFLTAVRPFAGTPTQPLLALYATRTVRGVSTYPSGVLGHAARVIVPGAHDAVVTAILAVPPAEKLEGRMRTEVQRRIAPGLARLPSTNDAARPEPSLPRRWCSSPAVEAYCRSLAEGPFGDHVSPRLKAWLENPERGELSGHLRLGMEAVSLFHAWWRLYRDVLRGVDADDLRGV